MSTQRIIFIFLGFFLLLPTNTVTAKQILVYGDSLSAAYGLEQDQGWVHLLSKHLGDDYTIVNASISGETSAGGKARIATTLAEFKPDLVLLELGANDGLRGFSVKSMQENLQAITSATQDSGAQVVIFGITLPPSYGPRYITSFEAVFKAVADTKKAHYFNFVVEKFMHEDDYIQADGLHPTAKAQPEIEQLIFDYLESAGLL